MLLVMAAAAAGILRYRYQRMKSETVCLTWEETSRKVVNPARGFYMQLYHNAPTGWMKKMVQNERPLAMITMDLQKYTQKKIPESELVLLRGLLSEARANGVMVFFRGSYKQKDSMEEPSLEQIHEHIGQLSELLNSYSDVVLMVQAGMIGLWGEWHASDYLKDETAVVSEAGKVVQWWLEKLKPEILVNLRRPSYIRLMEDAGMDGARLGFHNDGLLGSGNDLGTYPDREEDLKWCEENINGRFNGGEMPYLCDHTEPSNAVKEFGQLSLSYLNVFYNTEVLEDWKTREYFGENAYDYIERHLGYRYYVKSVQTPKYLMEKGEKYRIRIELGNTGFSSIVSRFRPWLVTEQNGNRKYIPLSDQLDEKGLERYEADVETGDFSPIRIGICYTDAPDPKKDLNPGYPDENMPVYHTVEMVGENNQYQDGINFFMTFKEDERTGRYMTPQK